MQRKTIIALLMAIVVVVGGYFAYARYAQPRSQVASEPEVEVRMVPRVVSASGMVVPLRWVALSFLLGEKIEELAVEVGDEVQAGMVLARLEATGLEQAVAQAEAALATARAGLAQVKAGPRPQEIAAAKEEVSAVAANLIAAQAARDQARATLEGTRASEEAAQAARDQAQAMLEGTRAGEEAAQAGLEAARAGVDAAQVAVAAAEAELTLLKAGASSQQRGIAKLQIDQARNSLWAAQAQRDSIGGAVDRGHMKDADLDAAEAAVGNAHVALNIAQLAYEEIEAGPRPQEIVPLQVQINGARATLSGAEAQVDAAQAQLGGAKAQVALAEAQVDAAQAQLGGARAQVALVEAQVAAAEAQVEAAQARVAQAQAQLELLEAGPRPEDVALAQAGVTEAEAALEAAESALAKAQLVSPFAGTVAHLKVREGEVVLPGQPILYLGDLQMLQVETTDLNEVDIAGVEVGQPVDITFDALPERMLTGRVKRIEPMATPGQGGTNYTVIISFEKLDSDLRWGMTAFVDIILGD